MEANSLITESQPAHPWLKRFTSSLVFVQYNYWGQLRDPSLCIDTPIRYYRLWARYLAKISAFPLENKKWKLSAHFLTSTFVLRQIYLQDYQLFLRMEFHFNCLKNLEYTRMGCALSAVSAHCLWRRYVH